MMRAVSTRVLSTVVALSVGLPLNLAHAAEPPADASGDAAEADSAADAPEEPAEGEAAEGEAAEEEPAEETEDETAEDETADEGVSAEGPSDDRGPPPSFGDKPATGKGLMIAGGVTIGVGVAFLATSVAITRCDPDRPDCRFGDQDEFLIPTAATGTAVGILLLTAGLINRRRYKRWEKGELKTTAFAPTYMPGGGVGLGAVGRF